MHNRVDTTNRVIKLGSVFWCNGSGNGTTDGDVSPPPPLPMENLHESNAG